MQHTYVLNPCRQSPYLQMLDGLAVLLLSAQLGHLEQDGPRVPRVLGLEGRRQLPALISLLETETQRTSNAIQPPSRLSIKGQSPFTINIYIYIYIYIYRGC